MKRLLAILCTLALVLNVINPAIFAAENSSLQAAMDDDFSEIIVLEEDTSNLTVNRDTYLDLNGHDVSGVTVLGGTLYCLDSQTADYTVADGVYGHVTNVQGSVKAAEGYLQVGDSFHAVNLDIYAMTLRASDVGVYYKSNFAADEVVAAQVESFGVALSVVTAPSEANLETYCGYSEFTGFEADEGANATGTSTLLKGIMKAANGDEKNAQNAAMPVYGRAYIKTADGYVFGETVKRSLQQQVEAIDGVWENLSDAQKAPVLGMLEAYDPVMESWNIPNIQGIQVPGVDAEIEIPVNVTAENGVVTERVTVEQAGVSVTVPAGTKLAEDAETLTLTVTPVEAEDTGLTLKEDRVLIPMDVHVEGLAADNAQPLTIYLGKIMPENLNMGNYTVYHVENGKANEMTLIGINEEFTAHNQYKYSLDGELTLYMASFSVVAAAVDEKPAWEGGRDYTWYDADAEILYIRNADQLAGFGAIVGGMDGQSADSFAGQTVVLLSDINLGDAEDASQHLFYPIGYYNDAGSYEKPTDGTKTAADVSSFEGTFDGNGNTIANFYQNTWQMWGNYDGNNYKAAMGLFGYVLNGTVKNLTVKNFSSDGEFTPTGVIAAYAENSTFENIALTECNPRVYNTGNGGIIGIGGRTGDTSGQQLILKNITVDNTNKISALWGSWDVACGGLVGMFRGNADGGNGTISFENCHVAAQIDVYNDVCANYQYYAYRYSGMMIGSVRHNVKDENGHVYPNMTGISASGCTVHFGDWNDYYYCELVANTTASYTHDHQMSRLVQIADIKVDEMKYLPLGATEWADIPTSGRVNYVVVRTFNADTQMWVHGDGHDYADCYHFVDGAVWDHETSGYHTDPFIDENKDGEADLLEDKQIVYREFNNLFTGYGWGVTSKGITDYNQDEIKILDRTEGNSVNKFVVADTFRGENPYPAGAAIKLEDLFKATADGLAEKTAILNGNVKVTVSPIDENGTVKATYAANLTDWKQGTLTFDKDFEGAALVTITDYYFCNPLTIAVNVTKYTADLYFTEGTTNAYCPACGVVKEWIEVNQNTDITNRLVSVASNTPTKELHYYLSQGIDYNGSATSFISTSTSSASVCFHLNGQNMQIQKDAALAWSSGGTINLIGDGTVTKTTGSTYGLFYTNTNSNYHKHNIYSGNYVSNTGNVIKVGGNGGEFVAYKGVVLEATQGTAVYVGTASLRSAMLTFEGVEIRGGINIVSPKRTTNEDPNKPGYITNSTTIIQDSAGNTYVTLTDTKVTGQVTVNNQITDTSKTLDFTVGGSTVIANLVLNNNAKAILNNLTDGAKIGVNVAVGTPFTVANENATAYRSYFFATAAKRAVFVENEQLVCKVPTYTDNLEFKADGETAYCPHCQADVQWTDITTVTGSTNGLYKMGAGKHYYISENITYSGTKTAFVEGPSGSEKEACFHLNGNNITSTTKLVFFGSSGTLNVMGDGTVAGGPSGSQQGSAVAVNSYTNGRIRLYSGAYTDQNGTALDQYTVSINGNGGWIEIFDDVAINSVNGRAINVGSSGLRFSRLIVNGATVNGNIRVLRPKESSVSDSYDLQNTKCQTEIELNGAKINGTVTVNDELTSDQIAAGMFVKFTISGDVTISSLVLQNNAKLILGELTEGAQINVADMNGRITAEPNENAETYQKYFHAVSDSKIIDAGEDNHIYCRALTVTDNLKFREGTQTAYCVLCGKSVTWEALTNETTKLQEKGAENVHYYLASDVEYTGTSTGSTTTALLGPTASVTKEACLHLNGKTLSAVDRATLFGSSGILNVLGSGTVLGGKTGSVMGTTVAVNSYSDGQINLYSGTYTDRSDAAGGKYVISINDVGGNINIYEDAEIVSVTGKAIHVGAANLRRAILNVEGANITGDINVLSPAPSATNAYPDNGNFGTAGQTEVTLDGVTVVDGVVTVDNKLTTDQIADGKFVEFTVSGATKIPKLVNLNNVKVTIGDLSTGAEILVNKAGEFTVAREAADAAEFLAYFKAFTSGYTIVVNETGTALVCQEEATEARDYSSYKGIVNDTTTWYNELMALPVASADMTETELRQLAADAFRLNLSFTWTPTTDINYSYTLLENSHEYTLPDEIAYSGLCYASGPEFAEKGNVWKILKYYDRETGALDIEAMGDSFLQVISSACSRGAQWGWNRVCNDTGLEWMESYELGASNIVLVGDYTYDPANYSFAAGSGTDDIIAANGEDKMYESYAKMLVADGLYSSSNFHVMMCAEAAHKETKFDWSSLSNKIDPDASYVVVHEQGSVGSSTAEEASKGTVHALGTVSKTYTFRELLEAGYVPFTFKELQDPSLIEDSKAWIGTETDPIENGQDLSVSDILNKSLYGNYALCTVEFQVKNPAGETLKTISPDIYTFPSDYSVKLSGLLDAETLARLDPLANGSNTIHICVRMSNGDQIEAFNTVLKVN